MADKFTPQELKEALSAFEAGVNEGVSPLLLQHNQLGGATNLTVRGTYASPRPAFVKLALNYGGNSQLQQLVEKFLFQGACYYKPDNGAECLIAAISGRLFQFQIGVGQTAVVTEIDNGFTQDSNAPQHWLWQSELYVIWNDGINLPVFYNASGTGAVGFPWFTNRSNYGLPANYGTFNTGTLAGGAGVAFVIPALNATVVGVTFNSVANLTVGTVVVLANHGSFKVQNIAGSNVDLLNVSAVPVGANIAVPGSNNFFWTVKGTQLPPGRMGVYGMGRNWISLIDGKQFVASDIEGGPSGSQALNYRDAVLSITENNFLVGGGNFSVPGSVGDIRAMRFGATLDASLGQGPLQVFTPNTVFSCNAPVDRTTWQSITNPILTESLIGNGALNHNATILVNGDFMFRSIDGIRSLILARRDFDTWGNVPQSREVDPLLAADSVGLLQYGSAVYFDNRLLMTANPQQADQGVYHNRIIALNFDPISSLRGKAPSVYDGQWIGLNVLQLISGTFGGLERCFAFTLNTGTGTIEIYEITKSPNLIQNPIVVPYPIYDNNATSIVFSMESCSIFNKHRSDPNNELLKRLWNGEIMVDNLIGTVIFQAYWKPDQWPCWVPWVAWVECSDPATTSITKPGFRPRMGLGEPPGNVCDEANNRPLREAYTFQFKLTITGHCRFIGARFLALTVAEDQYAKPHCCQIPTRPANVTPGGQPLPTLPTGFIVDPHGTYIVDPQGNKIIAL